MTHEGNTMTCPPDHKHGTTSTCYTVHNCACGNCRQGATMRMRAYRRRLAYGRTSPHDIVDGTGTARRIQALVTRGWTLPKLAAQVGWGRRNFRLLLDGRNVTVNTRDAIARLYDDLWDQTPPCVTRDDRASISKAKTWAKRNGWLPPLAWDDIDNDTEPATVTNINTVDDLAIELATTGMKVKLTPQERRIAVTQLHTLRLADSAIAARLHMNQRTVLRIRQELGLGANVGADGQMVAA